MVVSYHVGSGNQTQVLWKSNKCSSLVSHLYTLQFYSLKLFSLLKEVFLKLCVCKCMLCMCTRSMPGSGGGQKRVMDPLKLKLGMVVSHLEASGN